MRETRAGQVLGSLMGGRQRTALLVLSIVVLTAGCGGLVGDDTAADDSAPLDDIPAEADGIAHLKSGVVTDSTTETLMNGLIEMGEPEDAGMDVDRDVPDSWDEVLAEAENESGIATDDIHSVTMFAGNTTGDAEYAGFILKTDLDWEEFQDLAEEEDAVADVQEDSYNGVTVYRTEDEMTEMETWVADFDDGTFAFGPEPVVQDVIDTHQGDASGIDEELRSTFEGATEGYMTVAVTLSEEQSSAVGDIAAEEAGVGGMFVPNVDAMTMSYHTEDEQMNMEMDLVMQSTEDADSFVSFAEPVVNPPDAAADPDPEQQPIDWLVDSVDLDSEEERVSLAFGANPDDLLTAIEALDGFEMAGDELALQPTAVAAD